MKTNLRDHFSGHATTLITPFDSNGEVDESALQSLVEFQIKNGVSRLCPVGVTGETAALTDEEKIKVTSIVQKAAGDRARVTPDFGTECYKRTVELCREAEKMKTDGVLVFTPYIDPPGEFMEFLHQKRTVSLSGIV